MSQTYVHFVGPHDTLQTIAQHYYGTVRAWPRIQNRNRLKHPLAIRTGDRLLIPDVDWSWRKSA